MEYVSERCSRCHGAGDVCAACEKRLELCRCSNLPGIKACPICLGDGEMDPDAEEIENERDLLKCEDCNGDLDDEGFCPACDDIEEEDAEEENVRDWMA